MEDINQKINKIIEAYNLLVKGIETKALDNKDRAYGGILRAGKGLIVESIAKNLIEIAWSSIGGDYQRLSFDKKLVNIPISKEYISRIKHKEVRDYINQNIKDYYYPMKTDIHVSIDDNFICGIECKAYTENAMLKRILVDFTLLKKVYPQLFCVLFQLESQLGGDYSDISKKIHFGSHSTHTLLSYFDVDLIIITLLEGERKVDKPIHKQNYFKELKKQSVVKAINTFKEILKPYL